MSTSDQPFDVKIRVLATAGLRNQGWRVVVLATNRRSTRLHRLYRSAGIEDFVYLDEVRLQDDEQSRVDAAVNGWLAEGRWTFNGIRQWTFGTSWIGPQVLSSVSRRLLDGAPDPAEPSVRNEVEALLPQVVRTAARAEHLVKALQPQLAVLDEYNYTLAGPITDVLTASGRSLITVRPVFDPQALLPTRLTAKTRRTHHASVTARTLDALCQQTWTPQHEGALAEEFNQRYPRPSASSVRGMEGGFAGRDELVEVLGLPRERPLAVVFSHVLWDANLFYGEDLFDNFGDWLGETVRAAVANDHLNWILKLHPANISKARYHGSTRLNELEIIEDAVGRLPDHVQVLMPGTPFSPLDLYKVADVGLTVRGTAGLEMPCFGRPSLTAGTGRFEGLGFTIDSATRSEYLSRLADLERVPRLSEDQVQRAKWHAYALFRLREWRMSSFTIERRLSNDAKFHPLERNLVRTAEAGSLLEAADVRRLTEWILGDEVDYCVDDPLAAAAASKI